jgi:hypothetical protein
MSWTKFNLKLNFWSQVLILDKTKKIPTNTFWSVPFESYNSYQALLRKFSANHIIILEIFFFYFARINSNSKLSFSYEDKTAVYKFVMIVIYT